MKEHQFFDAQVIPDGYFILPISMSRASNSQKATECYEIIKNLQHRIAALNVDVIILYTTSLYYNNTTDNAWTVKKRLTEQMLMHKNTLERLVRQQSEPLAYGLHYMTWDETILHAPHYMRFYQFLWSRTKLDPAFYDLIVYSIGNREINEASTSFLIEETIVTHMLRQKMIPLPKSLVKNDNFRLVVYPGPYIAIDLYQWKHRILPQNHAIPFGDAHYDAAQDILYHFDTMALPGKNQWLRERRHS